MNQTHENQSVGRKDSCVSTSYEDYVGKNWSKDLIQEKEEEKEDLFLRVHLKSKIYSTNQSNLREGIINEYRQISCETHQNV